MRLTLTSVDYPEPAIPLRRRFGPPVQRSVDHLGNRPDVIRHADGHRGCDAQRLVHAAEIVVRHIQGDGSSVVFGLLAEPVRQSGEAARCHSDRQIRPLDVACL